MDKVVIGKNAKRIRLDRQLTQKAVAEKAGTSLLTYQKLESGQSIPRTDTLYDIAQGLGVGVQELLSPVRELRAVRFRAHKRLKKRDPILARASRWLEDFNYLIEIEKSGAEYTLAGIPGQAVDISEQRRPIEVARLARERLGLSQKEPIFDITGLLASGGVKILTYPVASDGFFGLSIAESDGGPAVVVNVWDRIAVERWIFSTAHELGHLLLHLDAFDVDVLDEDDKQEAEANVFASHFLMPKLGFDEEWGETLGLPFWQRVLKVKRIFRVSDKTVLYRLIERGQANDRIWQARNQYLKRHFKGARIPSRFEPEPLQPSDFVTDWLDRLVRIAVERELISLGRAAEILDIPLMEIRHRAASWTEEAGANRADATVHS